MKAIIIGGGIGGLATALSLHQRGIACEVFEQSSQIRELGVGINTLPHAIKELAALGLLDKLDDVAVRTHELIYVNRFGQVIYREPRGLDAGYDDPQFSIHRGRLQGVLHQASIERIGANNIHTGHRLVRYQQDDEGITAYFTDGRTDVEHHSVRGDVMIAADGINSTVRAHMFPNEGPPSWNGIMLWRGATDWPPYLTGKSMVIAGDMDEKIVLYPIAEGERPGTMLTNWAVAVKLGDGSSPPPRREDWNREGTLEDLMPHIQRFSIPYMDVIKLVESTNVFYEYPMCDRDPLPYWNDGRLTLLGDAAHPMYPVGSNGASQAVLDARALALYLDDNNAVETALAAYQADRLAKTAEIVKINRLGGPERVVDIVSQRAPDGFDKLEDVIDQAELEAITKGYQQLAGFDKQALSEKSP